MRPKSEHILSECVRIYSSVTTYFLRMRMRTGQRAVAILGESPTQTVHTTHFISHKLTIR